MDDSQRVSYCVGVVGNYNTRIGEVKTFPTALARSPRADSGRLGWRLLRPAQGLAAMITIRQFALSLALAATACHAAVAACTGPLDVEYRRLAGEEKVRLCDAYAGQVLLVVNTASKCGYTPQYEGLEALHQRLQARGFAVLGFPSNDFLGQEPGSEQDIAEFCTLTYGVKFPMFEKVVVKGSEATPLYQSLTAATGEAPGWNFHKYLIDREGQVVASFDSDTRPDDAELLARIEALLGAVDSN
jgi:glutathione peroxidase